MEPGSHLGHSPPSSPEELSSHLSGTSSQGVAQSLCFSKLKTHFWKFGSWELLESLMPRT